MRFSPSVKHFFAKENPNPPKVTNLKAANASV
jgi:hypothetical protein